MEIHVTATDSEKGFYKIDKTILWNILVKKGYHTTLINEFNVYNKRLKLSSTVTNTNKSRTTTGWKKIHR
jgi:hypothetical protein